MAGRRKPESAATPPPYPPPQTGEEEKGSKGGRGRSRDDQLVCLGRIVVAHGVRGEVGLETYTEFPDEIAAYGDFIDESGSRTFVMTGLRFGPKGMLATFEGVTDRNAAEDLKGTRLYVPRSALPRIRTKDEYYQADLIGLVAFLKEGGELGTVSAVHNFGAGDLLEVRVPDKRETLLVPFTKDAVPEVDLQAGRLVVDPPAGLLDEAKDGGRPAEPKHDE